MRVAALASLALVAPTAALVAASPAQAATVDVQILGTNDFHGRLLSEGTTATTVAGAAQFGGAIQQTRAAFAGDSLFVAAGDLIGASLFDSFIQQDKPTLDAFNAMRLDVSAAGNHEFDQGYNDLNDRVMAPYDATANPHGGAKWPYLAANVRKKSDNSYALRSVTPDAANNHNGANPSNGGTWMAQTPGGAKVGFVGAVTEDLPSLVSPGGIADVKVTKIVDEVKAGAQALKAQGADMVVMLVHEGAAATNCATNMDPATAWGKIVAGVETDVNAVVSGHTHLAYDCKSPVTNIPVVSSGQYGTNFNVLKFSVDTAAHTASVVSTAIQSANTVAIVDPTATALKNSIKTDIVDPAVAKANVLGAQVLGKLNGPFYRAKLANGTTENRGGESTLGNLVAEVQRWATSAPESGAAQISFMNPGGLRADMLGSTPGSYPANLTYKDSAVVQPFANTLVNMKLTGAQIKKVLEQQWQRDAANNVPSRPFLRLGTSKGFNFTYDVGRPEGDRITGMWLNGVPIDAATSYSVTVNSFLASGGDNFWELNNGAGKRDTGKTDLAAMVDYMAAHTPVSPDYAQHAVGVTFPGGQKSVYNQGDTIDVNLSSLAMTGPADVQDSTVTAKIGEVVLGTFPVDNTNLNAPFDESGKAAVSAVVPNTVYAGNRTLTLVGDKTGTTVKLPVTIGANVADTTTTATVAPATVPAVTGIATVSATVASTAGTPTGTVVVYDGTTIVGGGTLDATGKASIKLAPFATAGAKSLTVRYLGDPNHAPSSTSVNLTVTAAPAPVVKATSTTTVTATPASVKFKQDASSLAITVTSSGAKSATGSVAVLDGTKVIGGGALSNGTATVEVGPFDSIGAKTLSVMYLGDADTNASAGSVTLTVTKAKVKVKAKNQKASRGSLVNVPVSVSGKNVLAAGKIVAKVKGKKKPVKAKVVNGVAVLKLGKFAKPGKYAVKITYKGNATTAKAKKKITIKVVG